eukprot:13925038-Alexandrium_andersonii.AAC.1
MSPSAVVPQCTSNACFARRAAVGGHSKLWQAGPRLTAPGTRAAGRRAGAGSGLSPRGSAAP